MAWLHQFDMVPRTIKKQNTFLRPMGLLIVTQTLKTHKTRGPWLLTLDLLKHLPYCTNLGLCLTAV